MHRLTVASQAVTPVARHAVSGCRAWVWCGVLCGQKCGILCGTGFRTQGRPRPRQHWLCACRLSPTTRPLHRKRWGEVRVVGFRTACSQVQAGAGPAKQESAVQITDELMNRKKKKKKKKKKTTERVREGHARSEDAGGVEKEVSGLGEVG
jgi:hypothetical protein